jgi:hypothetical protein
VIGAYLEEVKQGAARLCLMLPLLVDEFNAARLRFSLPSLDCMKRDIRRLGVSAHAGSCRTRKWLECDTADDSRL